MADTSKIGVKNNFRIKQEEELPIDGGGQITYNKAVDTVSIRSLLDARVKVTGTVTGTIYTWDRAGSIALVDVRDKDEILNKKRGRACCGGQSGKSLFELA